MERPPGSAAGNGGVDRGRPSAMDTLSLLAEPFTFTQFRPLLPRQFIGEARQCGVWLSDEELEAWHRVRLLVPLYRLARDGREIVAAHRHGEDAYHLAHWQPTSRADLVDAHDHGRLYDASSEPFIARRRLKRQLGGRSYESSVYLYSRHQLAALQLLRQVRPQLNLRRAQGHLVGQLDAGADVVAIWRERAPAGCATPPLQRRCWSRRTTRASSIV